MATAKADPGFFDKYDTHAILTRYADVLLATAIIVIVGLMLVPLPTALLDILLTANIAIGLTILLTALYIAEPVKLSSFPTILLVATMFRLSLSIASTRLILADAYAGEVILSFGQFVAKGNLVVGFVVFVIITVVQFLVIAKGSERISEVAARFTLDAMPGKQMSIDADLRAGAFDLDTARNKRRALARESQFYGSMDGAMKFVKGDTIAGLVITAVNILGGLVIGITMRNMSASEAVEIYTLLTIGDGLVSQISALLVSTSAGMITTRVVGAEEGEGNLGQEIGEQLLDQPKAIMISGSFLAVMGLFTPLPTVPFLIVAGALGVAGYGIHYTRLRAGDGPVAVAGDDEAGDDGEIAITACPVPVVLELSQSLSTHMVSTDDGREFMNKLTAMRHQLYAQLGMRFPGVRLRTNRPVGEHGWVVRIFNVPMFRGEADPSKGFAQDPPAKFMGLDAQKVTDPVTGRDASLISMKEAEKVAKFGSALRPIDDYVGMHLASALKRHAADFLGVQETQALLDEVGKAIPALVKEVVPKLVPLTSLTEVLQRLVQEEVSIRDFRAIMQSLARWGQVEKDPATLAEYVRSDLKQQISFAFSRNGKELTVYLLDPKIESSIRSAIQRTAQGSYLALDPDTARKIMAAARKSLGNLPASASRPLILTAVDVRRYLKKLLELDLPQVVVLSYQEISPLLTVQPVGRISLGR
ncbi:MAG: type III secretion system export apparatus subunit SctV [Planctomycetota bacterium]|jgi:type III secretion protein V